MPVTQACNLGRLRQEDQESKVSLGCVVRPCLPFQKKRKYSAKKQKIKITYSLIQERSDLCTILVCHFYRYFNLEQFGYIIDFWF
jgi:hypothetical protein